MFGRWRWAQKLIGRSQARKSSTKAPKIYESKHPSGGHYMEPELNAPNSILQRFVLVSYRLLELLKILQKGVEK